MKMGEERRVYRIHRIILHRLFISFGELPNDFLRLGCKW